MSFFCELSTYKYIGWLFEPSKIPEVTKLSLLSDKKMHV